MPTKIAIVRKKDRKKFEIKRAFAIAFNRAYSSHVDYLNQQFTSFDISLNAFKKCKSEIPKAKDYANLSSEAKKLVGKFATKDALPDYFMQASKLYDFFGLPTYPRVNEDGKYIAQSKSNIFKNFIGWKSIREDDNEKPLSILGNVGFIFIAAPYHTARMLIKLPLNVLRLFTEVLPSVLLPEKIGKPLAQISYAIFNPLRGLKKCLAVSRPFRTNFKKMCKSGISFVVDAAKSLFSSAATELSSAAKSVVKSGDNIPAEILDAVLAECINIKQPAVHPHKSTHLQDSEALTKDLRQAQTKLTQMSETILQTEKKINACAIIMTDCRKLGLRNKETYDEAILKNKSLSQNVRISTDSMVNLNEQLIESYTLAKEELELHKTNHQRLETQYYILSSQFSQQVSKHKSDLRANKVLNFLGLNIGLNGSTAKLSKQFQKNKTDIVRNKAAAILNRLNSETTAEQFKTLDKKEEIRKEAKNILLNCNTDLDGDLKRLAVAKTLLNQHIGLGLIAANSQSDKVSENNEISTEELTQEFQPTRLTD